MAESGRPISGFTSDECNMPRPNDTEALEMYVGQLLQSAAPKLLAEVGASGEAVLVNAMCAAYVAGALWGTGES